MKTKQIIGLMLSLVLVVIGVTACSGKSGGDNSAESNTSSVEAIKERGKIKIAVSGEVFPYGYIDKNGKNQGYDVYLGKRLAKDLLGSEDDVEFVVIVAEERVDVLKSNKVDLVLANFTKTPERAEVVDFASPYMKAVLGIVSPKKNPITDISQLKGKKLIVTKGSTAETYFTRNYPDITLEKFESNSQQFNAFTDGRGDALADDNSYLYPWVKNNPDFVVGIKEIGDMGTINPAVKKGNTSLLNWLNEELARLGEQKFFHEDYDATLKDFFGSDVTADDIVIEGVES